MTLEVNSLDVPPNISEEKIYAKISPNNLSLKGIAG
jgi:hypothetical protein